MRSYFEGLFGLHSAIQANDVPHAQLAGPVDVVTAVVCSVGYLNGSVIAQSLPRIKVYYVVALL